MAAVAEATVINTRPAVPLNFKFLFTVKSLLRVKSVSDVCFALPQQHKVPVSSFKRTVVKPVTALVNITTHGLVASFKSTIPAFVLIGGGKNNLAIAVVNNKLVSG